MSDIFSSFSVQLLARAGEIQAGRPAPVLVDVSGQHNKATTMSNRTSLAQFAEMKEGDVTELPLDQLAMLLEDFAELKARMSTLDRKLTAELDRRFGAAAAELRRADGKDTGTVTLVFDNAKVRADLPKKVEWDQQELANAVDTIRSWGEDPRDYIAIEVKVAEAKFNAWPPAIRKLFEPARTVSTGKPSYKLELLREAA